MQAASTTPTVQQAGKAQLLCNAVLPPLRHSGLPCRLLLLLSLLALLLLLLLPVLDLLPLLLLARNRALLSLGCFGAKACILLLRELLLGIYSRNALCCLCCSGGTPRKPPQAALLLSAKNFYLMWRSDAGLHSGRCGTASMSPCHVATCVKCGEQRVRGGSKRGRRESGRRRASCVILSLQV